jgi:N-methylhydantoinase B
MVASCCGGGGYGPPWQREIPLVLRDVREGWVTAERAANVYGVALTPEGDIDELQTRRLRESLGGNGSAEGSDAHRMSSITEQASLRPANAQDSTIVAE